MRRNHSKHNRTKKEYQMDYIILPDHPEISHIIVKPMRTIYRNLAAWEHAPFTTVIKHNDDPAMKMLAGKI